MTTPITVFVADDHAIVREGLVTLLAAQTDIEIVGTAANGRDALGQVLQLMPQVVILDISMPELDGIETTRQIIAASPGTPIVILSMHASAQHVFQALEAGARGYLLKESAGKEVVDAVRTVHTGRRYLSAKIAGIVAEGVSNRSGVSPIESLSKREREILKLVADGLSSVEIGALLHLSPKTVDSYRSRLMQKLRLSDLAGLIKFAIQHGLTSLD
ncbi:MAG TPA: response regulator transcription factor [Burkholderiales bacterium]